MTIDNKAAPHLGRQWMPGGRGDSGGLDCLGLALLVCEPPPPDVRSMDFDPSSLANAYEVVDGEYEPGDLLLSHSIRDGRRVAHLSIVADSVAWCWTTAEATGVVKVRTFKMMPAKAYRKK